MILIVDVIKQLRDHSGKLDKIGILSKYKDVPYLKEVLYYTYNPYMTFGLKSVMQPREGLYQVTPRSTYEKMFIILNRLSKRELTGNAALDTVNSFIKEYATDECSQLMYLILLKDLKCGIAEKTIEAVYPGLIPTFEIMKAVHKKITLPAIAEEKFDGCRVLGVKEASEVKFYTSNGNILFMPSIEDSILEMLNKQGIEKLVFDGELLDKVSRKSTSGSVNKILKGTAPKGIDEQFVLHTFDVLSYEDFFKQNISMPLMKRIEFREELFKPYKFSNLVSVDYSLCTDITEIEFFYRNVIEKGGEGLVLKHPEGGYEFKRSNLWNKLKEEKTCELKVVGIKEGKGRREGKVGSLICESSEGLLRVDVGTGLTDKILVEFNQDSPIGKIIEVKFNSIITSKNKDESSLFLPCYKKIRYDKDAANTIEDIRKL